MDYFLTDALPFLYGSTTLQQTAIWNSDRNPEQLAALHSAIATKQLGGIVGLCTFHLLRLNAMESGNRGCATDEQMRPIIAAWQRIATELESQEEALDQHDAILEHVTTEVNTGRMDAETASRITAFAHSIAGLWPQWALYARLTSFTLGANTTSNNESRSCRGCCFFFFFFFFFVFFRSLARLASLRHAAGVCNGVLANFHRFERGTGGRGPGWPSNAPSSTSD